MDSALCLVPECDWFIPARSRYLASVSQLGWAVLDGIVTLVLGLLLWAGLPWSGLWFLGFALGIALLLRGWSAVIFAFAVRHISNPVLIRRVA